MQTAWRYSVMIIAPRLMRATTTVVAAIATMTTPWSPTTAPVNNVCRHVGQSFANRPVENVYAPSRVRAAHAARETLEQQLLLRGSREFGSRDAYEEQNRHERQLTAPRRKHRARRHGQEVAEKTDFGEGAPGPRAIPPARVILRRRGAGVKGQYTGPEEQRRAPGGASRHHLRADRSGRSPGSLDAP